MGIMREFCDALYGEIKAYETKKTTKRKKLHPARERDIMAIKQLLEAGEKHDPPNIRLVHQRIMSYLDGMKTAWFAGFIPLSSDLRLQLLQVLGRPQFNPGQMVLVELQEQQANQKNVNNELHTRLTQNEREINFLKTTLKQRDVLCEVLKTRCATLEVENAQLNESLKACADDKTAERFNQLHTQVTEQQTTITQLKTENENEKIKAQQLSEENLKLKEENRRLRHALKKAARSSSHIPSVQPAQKNPPIQATCYASPLKNTLPHSNHTATPVLHTSENTVELKRFS